MKKIAVGLVTALLIGVTAVCFNDIKSNIDKIPVIETRLDNLEDRIKEIKTELKEDIKEVKEDVSEIKGDIKRLENIIIQSREIKSVSSD